VKEGLQKIPQDLKRPPYPVKAVHATTPKKAQAAVPAGK
jgi:hypothetical protein